MRAFNGWVKETQIKELSPRTAATHQGGSLRVLDLVFGKGGDLGKWVRRGVSNYVGVDVALGSLRDAARRALRMTGKLKRCTFTCADLGTDVPGRPRLPGKPPHELLSWSLGSESDFSRQCDDEPNFQLVHGGGISEKERFDVVSIQFGIHYLMSSQKRASRFFHTVSQLLAVDGNLIVTTVDARVVLEHLMRTGVKFHSNRVTYASDNH
jgi:mRNA (guanine-N7-)-methyltransferase